MKRLLRQNIQIELYAYFSTLNPVVCNKQFGFTSIAFVQSGKKMKPEMFYDLNRIIAEDFYQDNDENVKLYKGHRLLSVDGTNINLPVNKMTRQLYGTFNNQKQTMLC
jgi:5-formaminoimidazole-4-carboxamide-1-beta-D-ribofuranosyl 5'-monophosphate synthetase